MLRHRQSKRRPTRRRMVELRIATLTVPRLRWSKPGGCLCGMISSRMVRLHAMLRPCGETTPANAGLRSYRVEAATIEFYRLLRTPGSRRSPIALARHVGGALKASSRSSIRPRRPRHLGEVVENAQYWLLRLQAANICKQGVLEGGVLRLYRVAYMPCLSSRRAVEAGREPHRPRAGNISTFTRIPSNQGILAFPRIRINDSIVFLWGF